MSRMLSKMNLISVVQQLQKEDIETIQGYVEMIENENEELKKQLEAKDNIQITFQQIVEKKCNQEVKFIKYLNNCIKELQKESTNKLQKTLNLGISYITTEILSKYKEIIGVSDDKK